MIILPAIDLIEGKCVRLYRGDFDTASIVAHSPVETAKLFESQGALWLHMVDLDGAKKGSGANTQTIIDVAKSTNLKIEVGGGIRDINAIEYYLSNGIERVILGSAAVKNPQLVKDAVRHYGEHIAVGIDAREGFVSCDGWLDDTVVHYLELAKRMEQIGVKHIIFTDISRDGTLTGPNLAQLTVLKSAVSCNIIASGGITDTNDIKNLYNLGLYGAICGKSLYEGTLTLSDALKAAGGAV